jgi:hypothetical protein
MTLSERPPGMGMMEVVVEHDLGRERGVKVTVARAGGNVIGMEVEVEVEKLEEMCRRGGVFGVVGSLWAGRGGT